MGYEILVSLAVGLIWVGAGMKAILTFISHRSAHGSPSSYETMTTTLLLFAVIAFGGVVSYVLTNRLVEADLRRLTSKGLKL